MMSSPWGGGGPKEDIGWHGEGGWMFKDDSMMYDTLQPILPPGVPQCQQKSSTLMVEPRWPLSFVYNRWGNKLSNDT